MKLYRVLNSGCSWFLSIKKRLRSPRDEAQPFALRGTTPLGSPGMLAVQCSALPSTHRMHASPLSPAAAHLPRRQHTGCPVNGGARISLAAPPVARRAFSHRLGSEFQSASTRKGSQSVTLPPWGLTPLTLSVSAFFAPIIKLIQNSVKYKNKRTGRKRRQASAWLPYLYRNSTWFSISSASVHHAAAEAHAATRRWNTWWPGRKRFLHETLGWPARADRYRKSPTPSAPVPLAAVAHIGQAASSGFLCSEHIHAAPSQAVSCWRWHMLIQIEAEHLSHAAWPVAWKDSRSLGSLPVPIRFSALPRSLADDQSNRPARHRYLPGSGVGYSSSISSGDRPRFSCSSTISITRIRCPAIRALPPTTPGVASICSINTFFMSVFLLIQRTLLRASSTDPPPERRRA